MPPDRVRSETPAAPAAGACRIWRSLGAVLLASVALGGCALPSLEGRTSSVALTQEEARLTTLGRSILPYVEAHPGLSGIHALADPHEAFAARMLMAQAAERTLDVQYYIWRGDTTGTLMLEALLDAAERGVRVRLLLDDNGTSGLDEMLAALDSHPNIEVRLFNPFVLRRPKVLGYLTDFPRLNRRMHNKSFTADNQATIVGGRNIGDEYFGASDGVMFVDLDVLAIGEVVADVSEDFDRYWQSGSSYPAGSILKPVPADRLEALHAKASIIEREPAAAAYMDALRGMASIRMLLEGNLQLEWAKTQMVSDDPAKGLAKEAPASTLPHQLDRILGEPKQRLDLVSPYFVPTASGTSVLVEMAQRGVQVRVLTNALEATDVAVVHSGYAKRREALLEGGVALYEMRAPSQDSVSKRPGSGPGVFGSSGSSLHAKTFAVDGERLFVGSFNFDPRSARLNTELGFVIDSPVLADKITQVFDRDMREAAYEVSLDENGKLYWRSWQDGEETRYTTEPGTSLMQRASLRVLQWLPIEPLL